MAMGSFLSSFFDRIFNFPIKDEPQCYKRSEDFHADEKNTADFQKDEKISANNSYEKLLSTFYEKLLEERTHEKNVNRIQKNKHSEKYPGWEETTVFYLHSLFLVFSDVKNKSLDFKSFSAILECLGDTNGSDVRKTKYDMNCSYDTGLLDFEDFLHVVYNFDTATSDGRLRGLSQKCLDVAEKTQLINELSLGRQLEYGLF